MSVSQLEKRLMMLETRKKQPNLVQDALGILGDRELDLCGEYCRLHESGFVDSDIQEMMGERYGQYKQAEGRYQREYERLFKERYGRI
jgi:hypothetical protein